MSPPHTDIWPINALYCSRVSDGLRKDICQLGRPGAQREEIDKTTITKHIPPHLQYACRYWVYHLQHSGRKIRDGGFVDDFLRRHFPHWLESLSLMGKISASC
jgi:hypothetical protein